MPKIPTYHGFGVPHEEVVETSAHTSPSHEGGSRIAPTSVTPPEAFGFVARPAGATSRSRPAYSSTRSLQTPSPSMFDARSSSPQARSPDGPSPHMPMPSQAMPGARGEPALEDKGLDELLTEIADEYDLLNTPRPSGNAGNNAVPPAAKGVTQAGISGTSASASAASSSQGLRQRISLEEVMANNVAAFTPKGSVELDRLRPSFHFRGKSLPFDRATPAGTANYIDNRLFIKEQVASILKDNGYRIDDMGVSVMDPLVVTDSVGGKSFGILPRLTSDSRPNILYGKYTLNRRVDMIAIVTFGYFDKTTLGSLYLVPLVT
ncbi:MAG TPA: hypothetical protein VME63_05330 [Dyella sp.]|uniref:hypothetical protein n=1 Tax=Dyella sp. TaxID=1869338 RepID=UPI002D05E1EF|nr:hypothetical protein [Dyella sp.]HTV84803.1 hypothetical protein [Dyella sp.]